MYLLENRRRATSFRLAPYSDRCKQLGFQSLELRRDVYDSMFAYDIFVSNINDVLINSKFVRSRTTRVLRENKLLEEQFHRFDYMRYQPIARLISAVNKYCKVITESNNREQFKSNIVKVLMK